VRKLSPLQDAVLFTVAVLIIAVIVLLSVLFPPPARSSEPTPIVPLPPTDDTLNATAAPTPRPSVQRASPAPPGSGSVRAVGSSLSGIATWYAWRPGQAAAGPGLRAALGPGWRGRTVLVTAGARSAWVRLTDWCACPGGRVIDLDSRSFAALAPLSVGVLRVSVRY
jgi:hypothetical protein